jgi:methylenetetrahydrofolate dehydrogenase (NADP+)/methenyltetrahydrofolate cyclohydrolase
MSPARVIDGKAAAARLRGTVATAVAELVARHGVQPGLAVVLVGEDPASQVYVRNKARQTLEAGMHSVEIRLPAETTQAEVLATVERLNADPRVHGILVQLPLPKQIDETAVINAIAPAKDVDGFHPLNAGLLATNGHGVVPCTPLGCLLLLKSEIGDLGGRLAVVVGRSNIVGKPMAQLLLRENCTVTVAHSRTRNLPDECRRADIVVAINRVVDSDANGSRDRLVGDVDFDSAARVASAITPVPGGVGPMTIACLLRNTVAAAAAQHGIATPPLD